jgi:hypothetical protein
VAKGGEKMAIKITYVSQTIKIIIGLIYIAFVKMLLGL